VPNVQVNSARIDAQRVSPCEAGVSIIVPLLNESAVVPGLIVHLQELVDAGAEIIIVDGGSHDGTRESLETAGFKLFVSEPGRAKQMNAGAAAASQAWLVFLHADTRLPESWANELRLADGWGRFDVRFDSSSVAMRLIAVSMNARSRLTGVATGDQAMFISRDVFASIGGFPAVPIMEDVAISKTLRQLQSPYCSRARATTSARRWQNNGVVKTVLKMWWYRLAFFVGVSPTKLAGAYDDSR